MPAERRKLDRRNFSYYMRVMDELTGKLVGHLVDISTGGFKLDSSTSVPLNKDYRLRLDLPGDISSNGFMIFSARSRWCRPDEIDSTAFNVGFQITNMMPGDFEIFSRIFERYGAQGAAKKKSDDYLWR
jgi:hypothetical protein